MTNTWRVEPLMDGDEWLGFWRLVRPDGTWEDGWTLPDTARGESQYQPNCFDGVDEAWMFAPAEVRPGHLSAA